MLELSKTHKLPWNKQLKDLSNIVRMLGSGIKNQSSYVFEFYGFQHLIGHVILLLLTSLKTAKDSCIQDKKLKFAHNVSRYCT